MIHVRRFVAGDSEGLVRTIDSICGEGRWMRTARFEPDAEWEYALAQPDCPCHLLLVAEDSEGIVGWCRVFPVDGRAGEATLGIGLLPTHRNRGLGTAMVRQALEWARQAGYKRVSLVTRSDNGRAIHVFRRCGFERAATAGEDSLEMICDLADWGAMDKGGSS